MTIRVPRYRPNLWAATIDGAGTFLISETRPTVLNGELYEAVCPLIDGVRTTDEIVAELRGSVSPAEVYYALDLIEQRGFLEDAVGSDDNIDRSERAFWYSYDLDPFRARANLEANPVRVETIGALNREVVEAALRRAGIVITADARFTVVATDDYRRAEIDDLDASASADGNPWALVKPVGTFPWIGPFFHPRRPGCWRCLTDRFRMNYAADTFVEQKTGQVPASASGALAASIDAVLSLTAVELARWIAAEGESPLVNTLLSVNLTTLTTQKHVLLPRPQCARCGDAVRLGERPQDREPEPIHFKSQPHRRESGGGHRTMSPQETLDRHSHLISPLIGVVSRLDRVSPPEHPLVHAYAASHNWASHPDSLPFLKETLRSSSGGKGTTDDQARVGAFAEAIERYSGVFRGDEIRRRSTLGDLGDDAIHPAEVLLFSDAQMDRRTEINAEGNSFQMVPEPFDPSLPADWSPMWAPTAGRHRWLPTGLLYYSYTKLVLHDTPNRLAYYADSNGCAAGNSYEEAALQALLELVERDAVATWWYNQVRRPVVAIDDLAEPFLDDLREWLGTIGRELWVLDVTNDIGIPTFAAVTRLREPRDNGSENLVVGFGAHLDVRVGIMRAVTEVNQFFASLFALGEGDLKKAFDPGAVQWWKNESTRTKDYLLPADGEIRRITQYADLTSDDLLAEVSTTIEMIESRNLEVLLLDQTRADIDFPVVKALVPGMRHFWARFAPGRLFEVPVNLGWLNAPLAESELNPTPVFF